MVFAPTVGIVDVDAIASIRLLDGIAMSYTHPQPPYTLVLGCADLDRMLMLLMLQMRDVYGRGKLRYLVALFKPASLTTALAMIN
jgi:hypothetical protein